MKINNFWGDLTDISAKKGALSVRCQSVSPNQNMTRNKSQSTVAVQFNQTAPIFNEFILQHMLQDQAYEEVSQVLSAVAAQFDQTATQFSGAVNTLWPMHQLVHPKTYLFLLWIQHIFRMNIVETCSCSVRLGHTLYRIIQYILQLILK